MAGSGGGLMGTVVSASKKTVLGTGVVGALFGMDAAVKLAVFIGTLIGTGLVCLVIGFGAMIGQFQSSNVSWGDNGLTINGRVIGGANTLGADGAGAPTDAQCKRNPDLRGC